MPELPEVEHTRKLLRGWLAGGRIVSCVIHDPRLVSPSRPRAFVDATIGRTVVSIDRRGKWLRLVLDDRSRVFAHLAMTGWFERAEDDAPLRFERARITVARGGRRPGRTQVAFVDPRRWGRWVASADDLSAWTELGPDPLRDAIDVSALHATLARRVKSSIKEALMDQRVLAGVGNIQATEALWRARIDPRSPAAAATPKELRAILGGVDWTIARTLADLAKGEAGSDELFLVYGRAGRPCHRCKTTLARARLGGRTTTYCPRCQVPAGGAAQGNVA